MKALFAVFFVLLAWSSSVPANAQKRVALVIGNSVYKDTVGKLPNTINDAGDMSATFTRLGFEVQSVADATAERMNKELIKFSALARKAEVAIVYYAGHGLEVNGENWLIPVDAELQTDQNLAQEAIRLYSILPIVEKASSLGLVILDACRNNPLPARIKKLSRSRDPAQAGFRSVDPPGSVLVAFAAKHGTVADDGDGRNSPFTTALLKHIEKPLEIYQVLREVRDDVLTATNGEQEPYIYGSPSRKQVFLRSGPNIPQSSIPAVAGVQPTGSVSLPLPPPPAPVTVVPPRVVWDHNSSEMRLIERGSARMFVYEKPRTGLVEVGVRPGTVAFEGKANPNGTIEGTAYLFSKNCGRIPYAVRGSESSDQRQVIMVGKAKSVDPETCVVSKEWDAVLNFKKIP